MKKFLRTAGAIALVALTIALLCTSVFAADTDYNVSRNVDPDQASNICKITLTVTPTKPSTETVYIRDMIGSEYEYLFSAQGTITGKVIEWQKIMNEVKPYTFEYYVSIPDGASASGLNITYEESGGFIGNTKVFGFPSAPVQYDDKFVADFPELKSENINVISGSRSIISLLDLIDLSKRPTTSEYAGSVFTFEFFVARNYEPGITPAFATYRIRASETEGTWDGSGAQGTYVITEDAISDEGIGLYITRSVYKSNGVLFEGTYKNLPIKVTTYTPSLTITAKDTQVPYNTDVALIPTDVVPDDVTVVWKDPEGNPITGTKYPTDPTILDIDFELVGSTNPEETLYLSVSDGTLKDPSLYPIYTSGSNDTDFIINSVTYKIGDTVYTVTPGNGLTVIPVNGEHKVEPSAHDFTVYSDPVDVTYIPAELDPETNVYEPGENPETTPEFHNGRYIIVEPNGGTWKGSPADQTLKLTKKITLEDPVRDGYVFAGWTRRDGTDSVRYIFRAQWVEATAKGKATLIKFDSINTEKKLENAVFELYRVEKDGEEQKDVKIGTTYVTGSDGTIVVTNLVSGSYYWKEIEAPEGYKLSEVTYPFEIVEENDVRLSIPNEPKFDAEDVFSDDHFAYIIGRPDGNVYPNDSITRAEVATIFFRLLDESVRDDYFTSVNNFNDVKSGQWFNNAISTMARMGIIKGYPDGSFKPNNPITRAEFAAIAARFDSVKDDTPVGFTDTAGHWAYKEINMAANRGWITGYPDHTFRPNQLINRCEAMTLVNRVTGRNPQTVENILTAEDGMITWPDNKVGAWYYVDVQEATNSHYYNRNEDTIEIWKEMRPARNWAELEY